MTLKDQIREMLRASGGMTIKRICNAIPRI